jgi:hypothetical protein
MATVTEALEEYIRHRKQLEILDLFGKIDYDDDYDYKKGRKGEHKGPLTPMETPQTPMERLIF